MQNTCPRTDSSILCILWWMEGWMWGTVCVLAGRMGFQCGCLPVGTRTKQTERISWPDRRICLPINHLINTLANNCRNNKKLQFNWCSIYGSGAQEEYHRVSLAQNNIHLMKEISLKRFCLIIAMKYLTNFQIQQSSHPVSIKFEWLLNKSSIADVI